LLLAVIFILEVPTASVAAAANCTHVMH
jgi:hypothetical protein